MILVDTSIWIDHLRRVSLYWRTCSPRSRWPCIRWSSKRSLSSREQVLSLLSRLKPVREVSHRELMTLVRSHFLFSRGLSVVDARLIGSDLITPGAQLWTRDRRMRAACSEVGGAAAPYE